MKSCAMFPTYTKFVHESGFVRWLNSQFFWCLKPSGSTQQLSFQLGRSWFLLLYGFSAISIGVFGFYAAFAIQPMFLSGLQQDLAGKAYGELLRTLAANNLLFLLPSMMALLGIWLLGFKGSLVVDAKNLVISKRYSCFNLPIWSKAWNIKHPSEMLCHRYGRGLVSSRIFQLRLMADDQSSKAILTCGNAFRDPLHLMAEKISTLLNVPLTSH